MEPLNRGNHGTEGTMERLYTWKASNRGTMRNHENYGTVGTDGTMEWWQQQERYILYSRNHGTVGTDGIMEQ